MKQEKTRRLTMTAMLGAMATVLMFIEIQIPIFPPFLKLDPSEIPALLASFALGPVCGIAVEGIKNAVHLLSSGTGGVGEVAAFLMGSAFVGTAGLIYQKRKNRGGALLGMAVGTVAMTLLAAVLNYFVMIPVYAKVFHMPLEQIVEMCRVAVPAIHGLFGVVMLGVVPFNLVKGVVVSLITMLLYKHVSPLLHGGRH